MRLQAILGIGGPVSIGIMIALAAIPAGGQDAPTPVNISNFPRAETHLYFARYAKQGSFGKLHHERGMTPIDQQGVIRMNRDTLYSFGIFDLQASPVTLTLPDSGKRFMSLLVVNEDHYVVDVGYAPGRFTYTREQAGTRYICAILRTLANPEDPADLKAANALQDAITVEQASTGSLDLPQWDATSQDKARAALLALGALGGTGDMFGAKSELDPVSHLIGSAAGWGGNPPSAATYVSVFPKANDGKTVHTLTVKDVPVDGFWSISLYNGEGYFEKNDLNAYSVNNLTARPNPDGSVSVQFGGCTADMPNCLPIVEGWNYTVRLYRPRAEILTGSWTFPEAQPKR